jgi:hypothetical protein
MDSVASDQHKRFFGREMFRVIVVAGLIGAYSPMVTAQANDALVPAPAPAATAAPSASLGGGELFGSLGTARPAMSGLENSWRTGLIVSGGMIQPFGDYLSIRGEVGFAMFFLNSDGFSRDSGTPQRFSGGTMTGVSGMVYGQAQFPIGQITPYALAGAGLISYRMGNLKSESDGSGGSSLEMNDRLSLSAGGGAGYRVRHGVRLFGEMLQMRSRGGDAYHPIKFGLTFAR